jgi:hypothetical protein
MPADGADGGGVAPVVARDGAHADQNEHRRQQDHGDQRAPQSEEHGLHLRISASTAAPNSGFFV